MARIYSRKKGKSGSKKPAVKRVPKWAKSKKEVEERVIALAQDRKSPTMIGLILRDKGVPDVKTITGKTIAQIIREAKLEPELPHDMMLLLRKAVKLHDHLERNKPDKHSKKGLEHLESKIRRLGKYYIRKGRLPAKWKYDREQAKLIVQK